MNFKHVLSSSLAIASIAALAAPANALSLKSSEYGDLFDTFNAMVNTERLQLEDSEIVLHELDAESLRWDGGADGVDVFFINEGAGHRNQLFYAANGGDQSIIFDDISSIESILPETQDKLDRRQNEIISLTAEKDWLEAGIGTYTTGLQGRIDALEASKAMAPDWRLYWIDQDIAKIQGQIDAANGAEFDAVQTLTDLTNGINWRQNFLDNELQLGDNGLGALALGDGVNLGGFEGDTSLNFLIKENGARNPDGRVYGAIANENPDQLQHVIAYEFFDAVREESWVILGFEDLFGVHIDEGGWSDRDFNDVVVAVRGVTGDRLTPPESVPEPSAMVGLLGLGVGMWQVKRRQSA